MKVIRALLLCIAMILALNSNAQNQSSLPLELEQKIDRIFEDEGWKMPKTPGIAFAILQDNKIVYKKSFGASDIENKIPITSKTRFNLAHTSSSFTAYAILKLVAENKITLDEDVRNHIDALKNFSHKITVRNLLTGSSGIYDFYILMSINGWDTRDHFTQKNILKSVSQQKEASFAPGTDYAMSRTNFVILAELIKRISEKSYKQYMQEDIFMPAGMKNTFVRTNSNSIYPNLAKAYRTTNDKVFTNDSKNEIVGSNNIFSTIDDLILWEQHLAKPTVSQKKIIALMNTYAKLNNGRTNSTSRGNLTLGQYYGHKERGVFSTYITGSSGGHDSSIFKFPNQNYIAIALSNDGNGYNGYTGVIAAHRILEEHFTEPETVDFATIKTKKLSNDKLKSLEGHYWDQLGELSREIKVVNDTLRYIRTNNISAPLIPIEEDKFQMKVRFDDKIYILFPKGQPGTMLYQYDGAESIPFKKYQSITYTKTELINDFAGIYLNKEYNTLFRATAINDTLTISNSKIGEIKYTPIQANLFVGDKWFMQSIEFKRNTSGEAIGFYIKNDAIRNLYFEKINKR